MTNLPAKRPDVTPAPDIDETPTWRELRERSADLLKEMVREGKDIERELEPRILPALRKLQAQIEKLIARIEKRLTEREQQIEPDQPPR